MDLPPFIVQEFLLRHLLSNPHFLSYPPTRTYQRAFWKWAIERLEHAFAADNSGDGGEVDEQLYSHFLGLSLDDATGVTIAGGLTTITPPQPSYVTYFFHDMHRERVPSLNTTQVLPQVADMKAYFTVTIHESQTLIESGTTGLATWNASFVLADYLLAHREEMQHRSRILELGCGTGFLGIVIARLQMDGLQPDHNPTAEDRPKLTLTDVNEDVLSRARSNVRLPCNALDEHAHLDFDLLDWTHSLLDPIVDCDRSRRERFRVQMAKYDADLVVGADLVYDPSIISPLVETLYLVLAKSTSQALLALTVRKEATFASFLRIAMERGLTIEDVAALSGERIMSRNEARVDVDPSARMRILRIRRPVCSGSVV